MGTALRDGMSVALSTHVNADGDGCGSEVALVHLLAQRAIKARIVNPTPWPSMFDFLLGDICPEGTRPEGTRPEGTRDESRRGAGALGKADALIVVDISDVRRLGSLTEPVRAMRGPRFVIDHHVPGEEPLGDFVLADIAACATGELVYDFARVLDLDITPEVARALYTAILTDTGGFRFSNTSPRCHAVAGELLAAGVDPEEMYRRIYASLPVGRLHLLRDALESLEVDASVGLSWISLPAGVMEKYSLRSEELDGIAEHPRSIAGTRMAIFFRDLGHGQVKVSFRSAGSVDVNKFARRFGGGGHAKAAGALIPGTLETVRDRVVGEAREFLASSADGRGPTSAP
jgi:phosphoesterase RecJ-like protein